MESTNESGAATPPKPTRAETLTKVLSLATQFSTCVEAFNLIHPHRDSDHAQKVALAKLGIQQGRLLIFGDAVGISSPPVTIARHMIPSHPGITNPDPTLPVHFGLRDLRLDEVDINEKVRAALSEIEGRPSHLTREELMEKYGLKSPKKFGPIEHPALDTNRLEAFREKYALLQDLARQMGIKASIRRGLSMTMSRWLVRDVNKFEDFVRTVRLEVDGLIALMGVREQVDRGMRSDIKAMAWHPDPTGPVVRADRDKLKLIREAVASDYPEYEEVAEKALKHINDQLKETKIAAYKLPTVETAPAPTTSDAEKTTPKVSEQPVKSPVKSPVKQSLQSPDQTKRLSFMARLKSWGKNPKTRSKSIAKSSEEDPQRSLSADVPNLSLEKNDLEPTRSKSLSALPDETPLFNLDSRLETVPTQEEKKSVEANGSVDELKDNTLVHANTANSLVDRHDMYKDVGRIETKDLREKSHQAAGTY